MNRTIATLALFGLGTLPAATGCGGGGSVNVTPRTTPTGPITTGTPPASLAAITPAPALPTVPPANYTPAATMSSASPFPAATFPSSSPAPAPAGSDLAALTAGNPPSAAYLAELAKPITPAYPLADAEPKAVLGTVAGFTANGIAIDVSPAVSATPSAGVPYVDGINAVNGTRITAVVSGSTADLVPGGYGALRVGSLVMVLGSGPASAFVADVVQGGLHETSASTAALVHDPIPATFARRSPAASVHPLQAASGVVPFTITNLSGQAGGTTPSTSTSLGQLGCISASVVTAGNNGWGTTANFPMQLVDVSDPTTFAEGQMQPLPVQLINGPSTGDKTYVINYGYSVSGGFTIQTNNCPGIANALYPLNVSLTGTGGQGLSATTTDELPGTGNIAYLTHGSCPFIPIPVAGGLSNFFINTFSSPSISFCFDFQIDGANVGADAAITNAEIYGGSNVTNDSSSGTATFSWSSTLPMGDPQVTVLPLASVDDGSDQPNVLTLDNISYNGNMTAIPMFTLGGYGFSVNLLANPFPVNTVFQYPSLYVPYSPILGVSQPSSIQLTLNPHGGTVIVNPKARRRSRVGRLLR
jgi:hypothetical protein